MSNVTKYLDIYSNYRDRNKWPLTSQFEVPIAQSGAKDAANALDPVCYSSPVDKWTGSNFAMNSWVSGSLDPFVPYLGTGATLTAFVADSGANDQKTLIIQSYPYNYGTVGQFQRIQWYYNGVPAEITFSDPVNQPPESQRIEQYTYMGFQFTATGQVVDTAQIILENQTFSKPQTGDIVTIRDPTQVEGYVSAGFLQPFIRIFIPNPIWEDNAYYKCYIYNETLNKYARVLYFDSLTKLATAQGDAAEMVGWKNWHSYTTRLEQNFTVYTAVPDSTSVFEIVGASPNMKYVNNWVRVHANNYGYPITPENTYRQIIAFDYATNKATVNPAFDAIIGYGGGSTTIEVIAFSYDNAVPFSYNGSLVSQQQEVCYDINLIKLILPNQLVNSPPGGRAIYYPYVYVELQTVSSGQRDALYSNNPNATKMLFVCPVDDIALQTDAIFLKISGNDAIQTIKFKPNDNLIFSVRLPNGQLFDTIIPERYSPEQPQPVIQINALFGLTRRS